MVTGLVHYGATSRGARDCSWRRGRERGGHDEIWNRGHGEIDGRAFPASRPTSGCGVAGFFLLIVRLGIWLSFHTNRRRRHGSTMVGITLLHRRWRGLIDIERGFSARQLRSRRKTESKWNSHRPVCGQGRAGRAAGNSAPVRTSSGQQLWPGRTFIILLLLEVMLGSEHIA